MAVPRMAPLAKPRPRICPHTEKKASPEPTLSEGSVSDDGETEEVNTTTEVRSQLPASTFRIKEALTEELDRIDSTRASRI